MNGAERSLLVLSRPDCVALLAGAHLGRAVFNERALPAVVPVAFVLVDEAVVFCAAADTRLASVVTRGVLAFEVDDIDVGTHGGWSVVVTGVAELVDDRVQQAHIRHVLQAWPPGSRDVFVRLPLTVVTGCRIATSVAADDVCR